MNRPFSNTALFPEPHRFPVLSIAPCTDRRANALLVDWDHPLGACNRPFGQQAWTLDVEGDVVAVAVSASTVSKTLTDEQGRVWKGRGAEGELVELARIARHPEHPFVLRPMLRLWREYLARTWPYWPVGAAVSYAMPGTPGDIYRFDGWKRVRDCKPSPGGGTWTMAEPKVSKIANGIKSLWIYRYGGVE